LRAVARGRVPARERISLRVTIVSVVILRTNPSADEILRADIKASL
jgi:hypothetical protein